VTSALDKAKEVGSQRGLSLCYHALGAVQYLRESGKKASPLTSRASTSDGR